MTSSPVWRRDDDQVELRGSVPEVCGGLEEDRAGMSAPRFRFPARIAGHNRREPQPRGRLNQRRVKDSAREAVPDEPDVDLLVNVRRQ